MAMKSPAGLEVCLRCEIKGENEKRDLMEVCTMCHYLVPHKFREGVGARSVHRLCKNIV